MTLEDVRAVERVDGDALVEDGAGAVEHGIPGPEETLTAQIDDRQIPVLEVDERPEILDSARIRGGRKG